MAMVPLSIAFTLLLTLTSLFQIVSTNVIRGSNPGCQPFHTTFSSSDAVSRSTGTPFIADSPEGSYAVTGQGLELYLDRPQGKITRKGGVNNVVADGATVNSTFTFLYGKLSLEFSGPRTPGVVAAGITISQEHDEIDVELVGGDPRHWQSNVFAYSTKDKEPLWGVFGEIEDYSKESSAVAELHKYTIDWSKDRIVWSVDGKETRTLHKGDTERNGSLHFPSHQSRIQLGIWDASSPVGTSEWAHGPIDWEKAPQRMTAVFRSVSLEC